MHWIFWLLIVLAWSSDSVAQSTRLSNPYLDSVNSISIASSVTTNTTSTAVAVPRGSKSIYGQVVGTGSVTQTQAIYGDVDNDAANGVLLCTLTLSGITRAQDACPVITANFRYYYVVTTATSGTSATGSIYAMH